jgi:BirA family biotin operon repressor/biotin-[acetyl-CoA-carboxylase] ligase
VAQAWRLPAVAALAMLDAAAALLGPGAQRLALKWPNDIVAVQDGESRKIGGVLAEGSPDGQRLASSVVGVGINVDWPAADFPAPLATTMGSLREAGGGRPVDRETLLIDWLARLGPLYTALLEGSFDSRRWADAQVTTGAEVSVDTGRERLEGIAVGVDPESGALLLREVPGAPLRSIAAGDVMACRVSRSARPL